MSYGLSRSTSAGVDAAALKSWGGPLPVGLAGEGERTFSQHGVIDPFRDLPIGQAASRADRLAADGVSCKTYHQITSENVGSEESFVGGFEIETTSPMV